jgi:hypothetical protein
MQAARRIALAATVFVMVASTHANAAQQDPMIQWEQLAKDHAYVTPLSVSAPLGQLILVRYKDSLCAIRFTEPHRAGDSKTPTPFDSGEETWMAAVEQMRLNQEGNNWRSVESKSIALSRARSSVLVVSVFRKAAAKIAIAPCFGLVASAECRQC